MNTQIDKQVYSRYVLAVNTLVERGKVDGFKSYCAKHKIEANNNELDSIHFDHLQPLVIEYGVSSLWLLTGIGRMFLPAFDEKA